MQQYMRVQSMPASKGLPPELLEALTEREYSKIESDDVLVKKSYGMKN